MKTFATHPFPGIVGAFAKVVKDPCYLFLPGDWGVPPANILQMVYDRYSEDVITGEYIQTRPTHNAELHLLM